MGLNYEFKYLVTISVYYTIKLDKCVLGMSMNFRVKVHMFRVLRLLLNWCSTNWNTYTCTQYAWLHGSFHLANFQRYARSRNGTISCLFLSQQLVSAPPSMIWLIKSSCFFSIFKVEVFSWYEFKTCSFIEFRELNRMMTVYNTRVQRNPQNTELLSLLVIVKHRVA